MNGFVKIHKRIVSWEWYTDPNTFRLFIHLLLNANFKSNRWMGKEILPGQLVTGRKRLSIDLKLSEREIRTSLTKLKTTNEITIKTTNKFSIITICKWDNYQTENITERPTKRPTNSPTSDQQTTTLEEGKEYKNNISVIFDNFRKQYPGTKRGLKTELDVFQKKNNPETIHLLMPALEKEKSHKSTLKSFGQFVPEWKNLATWINQKCWEQEFPEVQKPLIGKQSINEINTPEAWTR